MNKNNAAEPGGPRNGRAPEKKVQPSLAWTYVLQLVAVGAFLSLFLIGNASYRQRKTVYNEMEQRGLLLGESLAGACSLPYFFGNMDAVRFVLNRAAHIQDVWCIALLDATGRLEMSAPPNGPREAPPSALPKDGKVALVLQADRIHVLAPLVIEHEEKPNVTDLLSGEAPTGTSKRLLGYIHLTLSLERAQGLVRALVGRGVTATLAIIALGVCAAFLFFRRAVLAPLRSLAEAMSEVRRGNLKTNVTTPSSSAEIVHLTDTFNQMTQDLAHAEDALKSVNAALEERVRERTQDLEKAYQDLRDSQDRVLRTEKLAAIGQLASGVGHELRNPLAAIHNVVYYLRDALKDSALAKEDPTLAELLEVAEKEINNADHIIGDLLDFSRVVKLAPQSTDVRHLLQDMRKIMEIPANVQWVEDFEPDLPPVLMDPVKMRQVFLNLANNAVQAMNTGGALRVSVRREVSSGEKESQTLCVDFQDTGVGISLENLKKIFEPLFTTKAKGTGLGLAICAGIVQAHGGNIVVQSAAGKGSTFSVRLPMRPGNAAAG